MLYCPPNVTLSQIWIDHGISHCFMDTVGSSVCGGFMIVFGLIQLLMYRKYAIRITDPTLISRSRLYGLQLFLLAFFPFLQSVRFLLNARIYEGSAIYGYMVRNFKNIFWFNFIWFHVFFQILSTCFICVAYPLSMCLVIKERLYQLPSVPTRGHGLVLLLFWTLAFINESLAFINLRHEDWWFNLKR